MGRLIDFVKKMRAICIVIVQIEIWIVTPVVAASFVSTRLLQAAVAVVAVFWLLRLFATKKLTVRTPADWAIVLLLIMIPVTLWATALPEKTIPQVYRLLTGIGLFYAIVNWAHSKKRLKLLYFGVATVGILLALMSTVSVEWFTSKLTFIPWSLYEHFTILVADTVHPNVMAGNLVILLPVAFSVALFAWSRLNHWELLLTGAAVTLMTVVIVLTKSRGAWLAFGALTILLVSLRWRRGWLSVPLAFTVCGVIVYSLGVENVVDAIITSGAMHGIDGRVEVWSRSLYMIQDFPFTGIGLGSFMEVADILYPFFLQSPGSIVHAHNLILQVAVDIGIPGLIAWLAVLGCVIFTAWRVFLAGKRQNIPWFAGVGAGLLASQIALIIHGQMDAVTWGMVKPAPLLWVLWGMAIASGNMLTDRTGKIEDSDTGILPEYLLKSNASG